MNTGFPRMAGVFIVAFASVAAVGFRAPAVSTFRQSAELGLYLEKVIGLNAKESAAADSGRLVTKVLHTAIDRDVVVFGVVAVDVPRRWFVDHFRDVDIPLKSPQRSVFGLFGKPALPSDVGQLALSKDDVKDLKGCRPRSCSFKLPASSMSFMNTRVDWNAPNVTTELAAAAREQMATYVNDYRQHGNDAMVVYDDNASVKSSDALAGLLADSPPAFPSSLEFQRYLVNPFEPIDSVTSTIFWSQDQMPRTRAIVSIHELSVFTPGNASGATIISTKQLWADHYLEASVDLMSVVDRAASPANDASGVYLVMVRDFRFDNLPNNRLFSIRNRVVDGLRDQAEADLTRIKQSYEENFHQAKVPGNHADNWTAAHAAPVPATPHPGLAHPTG